MSGRRNGHAARPQAILPEELPHNLQTERAVLGGVLLNPAVVEDVVEVLGQDPEVFLYEPHQHVYRAILALRGAGRPVDVVLLYEALDAAGAAEEAGGASYIAELTGAVPTSANATHYAEDVAEAWRRRRLIDLCSRMTRAAMDGDPADGVIETLGGELLSIGEGGQGGHIQAVSASLEAGVARIEALHKSGGVTGLRTGLLDLDRLTGGFQRQDLILLAARPSIGKTALSLEFTAHAAVKERLGVLFFSLEMSREALAQRLLCNVGRIDTGRLCKGFLAHRELDALREATQRLAEAPIWIDDTPGLSLGGLRARARAWALRHEVRLIVVDYLQLVVGSKKDRREEVTEISRVLKAVAREIDVPLIALSQLSREAEKDTDGPQPRHMMESGSLEADADVVMMLSRFAPADQEQCPDGMVIAVKKQRNRPTGRVEALFQRDTQVWRSLGRGAEGGARPLTHAHATAEVEIEPYHGDLLDCGQDDIPFD